MEQIVQKVSAYFRDRRNNFLELLEKMVMEETPSDQPDAFQSLLSLLTDEFQDLNYKVTHIEGDISAGQLLCVPENFNESKPVQLSLGHIDTVWDKGTLIDMPFKIEGNTASGPGIYDMKTGICMMVFALKAIQEAGASPEVQPVFLISTDEETGSHDSKDMIIEQAKLAERTFVLEPSLDAEGKIKTERKGVGHFEIVIKGKPSHAGLDPEKGVSAILGLSHIVQQLFELNDPEKGISVNVGTIEGGERSNVIAAKSKAIVDVRIKTEEDGKRIEKEIRELKSKMEGIQLEVKGGINRPPMEKNKSNEKLWKITSSLGDKLGLELKEGMSGGASDGNFSNQYSPTIDGLGAVGSGAHAYHEQIAIKESLDRAALYTLLLLYPSVDLKKE